MVQRTAAHFEVLESTLDRGTVSRETSLSGAH